MRRTLHELLDSGAITGARDSDDPAAFFGFRPDDVAGVHFHKSGARSGVWFRLKDGRVFNRYGGIDDPDPAQYESAA
jgi:hypothetical protein